MTSDKSKLSTIVQCWRPTDLIIIGGQPTMGKTALIISAAINCAKENKRPVAIFSLELPIPQIKSRFIKSGGDIG